ncbi:N-acetylglucosamine-phosphate mutase-like protein [Peziza echinospora]|nr:N-acetylglucosamine-phosphate mutase-like protein [Peziza echinospora]
MAEIVQASAQHPKPEGEVFSYGTAGFRMKAHLLDSVMFRVGLLASLRSKRLGGQTIGVMVTASHNVPEDNGVKLVDPMGEMLEGAWEPYATLLANSTTDEELYENYEAIIKKANIRTDAPANVVYARDTRESGPALVASLVDALNATGTVSKDYGILTTPQLHYIVRCINTRGAYGEPTEEGYYRKIGDAYKVLMKGKTRNGAVTVDCANGVGAPKLKLLAAYIGKELFEVKITNDDVDDPSKLNHNCGADYVKTQQRIPPGTQTQALARYASLDGDADRLMYFFVDTDGTFHMLDGDKIATLAASFIGDLAKTAGLTDLRIGVVQTAYANGASTAYIQKSLNLPTVCTPTGVKYLHHAAMKYDCGVYFEANGHGTVLFSPTCLTTIETHEAQSPGQKTALDNLKALTELINQTVGDALSDLLMVEVILAHKGWTPKEWDSTYTDLPNRLVRVEVNDRTVFKTTDAERRLISPPGVQDHIDAIVGKYKLGRAFARASGTENAVRVYAESQTRGETDDLALKVKELVKYY